MRFIWTLFTCFALSACGLQLPGLGGLGGAQSQARAPGAEDARPVLRPGEVVEDTGDAADGAADPGLAAQTGDLGQTIVSLGDATRAGLWLETPLVAAEGPGLLRAPGGTALEVRLIPSGGAPGSGSRISLQAMQGLGLPLTALTEISVEAL
ncbi:MAG: hypothetical protein AAFN09_06155 [Pseudomonadota bacterium]